MFATVNDSTNPSYLESFWVLPATCPRKAADSGSLRGSLPDCQIARVRSGFLYRNARRIQLWHASARSPDSGNGKPVHTSVRLSVKSQNLVAGKRLAGKLSHEDLSQEPLQVASNFTNFQEDPMVDKLRTQLGVIHPIPSPPINRNIVGLFVFFFFFGAVVDKLWTWRKRSQSKRESQSGIRPQVPTSFSQFLEKDLQRKESVEWVNMVLGKLWKVYQGGIENWIIGLLQPVIDDLKKPGYVQRVEIKQFSLGNDPLSVRNVERRTSRRANDLQYQIGLRYTGGARMLLSLSLKFGIIPIVLPVGVSRRSSPSSAALNHARLIFRQVSLPSICVWNAFLRALFGGGALPEETLAGFILMKRAWIKPDRFTFPSILQACGALSGCPVAGEAVHGEILRTGLEGDLHVHSSLINMYSKNGSLESALKVFDGKSVRDVVTWNSMVACFFRRQEVAKGRELFEMMPERNGVSWNTVITGYAQNGRAVEALELFRRMQLQGWRPSEATLVGVLSACAQAGALDVGKWVHRYLDLNSIDMDLKLSNSLIDMYAKGGSLENARKLFDAMDERSVVSWNCMIGGLALHGHGAEAIHLFGEMERGGVCPDEITFVGVLSACAHAVLVEEGRSYFNIMEKHHGIAPKVEHYGCMIDILGRGGHLAEAQGLIKTMPVAPDAGVWGALLSACLRHGRLDLAEDALLHLLELEPWNAGNHVLLSNMLAARGCWSEVERVRHRMKASYVGKTPGSSSIEIDRSVWEFVAGDRSHPRSEEIYATLEEIGVLLKLAAHAQERESVLYHVCIEDDEHLPDRDRTHYGKDRREGT